MTVHGMHREASIEIHASPEAVYALVSDLPRMGEWSPENIGGEWQKKLTLSGLDDWVLMMASSVRMASMPSMAQGSDPNPPALDTATASAPPCTPAIGA